MDGSLADLVKLMQSICTKEVDWDVWYDRDTEKTSLDIWVCGKKKALLLRIGIKEIPKVNTRVYLQDTVNIFRAKISMTPEELWPEG